MCSVRFCKAIARRTIKSVIDNTEVGGGCKYVASEISIGMRGCASVGPATANSWLVAASLADFSLADDQLATANVSASSYSYPKYGILASLSCSCASWQLSHQLSQVIDHR